jgi:hypothetical protein
MTNALVPGDCLGKGDSLRSLDGRFELLMALDGQLVVYNTSGVHKRSVAVFLASLDLLLLSSAVGIATPWSYTRSSTPLRRASRILSW